MSSKSPQSIGGRIADLRKEYKLGEPLDPTTVHSDPLEQFRQWFGVAESAGLIEPNAMALATADHEGRPSVRIVLLKDITEEGLIFFTNYESRKGSDLHAQPYAALLFYWQELERQVRIEGKVAPVSDAHSDSYFASRPRSAQLGAHASLQSQKLERREALEERARELDRHFHGKNIPRPAHWGGYLVVPERYEFWQGRESRLHDRVEYLRAESAWTVARLQP